MDPQWEPVKEYIRKDLGVNTDREQCWWDDWDEAALRQILAQQKKITQQSKQLGMKKLYQVLIVIDDHADNPAVHRKTGDGILDTLFIRGRHYCISTWVSTQKLRLMSSAVRVNTMFYCVFRLRNQLELDALVEELSVWNRPWWRRLLRRLRRLSLSQLPAPAPVPETPADRDGFRGLGFVFASGRTPSSLRSLRRLQGLQRLPPLPPNPFRRHHSL